MYTADLRGSKYSPLDQINASNFSKLEVGLAFQDRQPRSAPRNKLEGTPIMVKGSVYATPARAAPSSRSTRPTVS
jgi:quinoprotein glucose dehydrogenase